MDETARTAGSFAVLFRTHFWDEYAERQYQRLLSVAGRGDVFILVDETSRPVLMPHANVVPHTTKAVLDLGLSGAGHGNTLWFNGDYPLYHFYAQHDRYDFYIMSEYDVVALQSLDSMVDRAIREGIDLVSLSNDEPVDEWPLTHTCRGVYRTEDIRKALVCISLFSNKAVRTLLDRRRALSRQHEAGTLEAWPYCEAFIPTETAAAGLKMAELSSFGATVRYDWKPAVLEAELPALAGQGFVHPVLDEGRYVQHTMKDLWPPEAFLDPRNDVGRRLRRAPLRAYGAPVAQALWRRLGAPLRRLRPGPASQT